MATSVLFTISVVLPTLLLAVGPSLVRARICRMEESSEESVEDAQGVALALQEDTSCCVREQKMKNIGLSDATGEEILIDVGHCRKHCSKRKQLKRTEFQRLLQENPEIDPLVTFLTLSGQSRGEASCPDEEVCTATASRVERLVTTGGVVSVTVTEKCHCQARPHSCRRQPRPVTLHKGTPLQTTVDVGDCHGHCSHELGCRATKSRTVSVEGPNGAECVSVVEECGCETSCYRASLFEQLYNYTSLDDPRVEVIDVGTCIGDCDTTAEDFCFLRESNGGCLMSLLKKSSRCAPAGITQVQVTQADGSVRTLTTITHCTCQ